MAPSGGYSIGHAKDLDASEHCLNAKRLVHHWMTLKVARTAPVVKIDNLHSVHLVRDIRIMENTHAAQELDLLHTFLSQSKTHHTWEGQLPFHF